MPDSVEEKTISSIKAELNAWLDENWRTDRPLAEWRELLVDSGWAAPDWPIEFHGRGYSVKQADAVAAVFSARGVVGAAQGVLAGLPHTRFLPMGQKYRNASICDRY